MTRLNSVHTTENETEDYVARGTYFADLHVHEHHSKNSKTGDGGVLAVSAFVTSLDALEIREVTTKNGTRTRTMTYKNEYGDEVTITLFELPEKER